MEQTDVVIAGAGPVGLMLALELHRHGVKVLLVERNPSTTTYPKMDITNGRSMELFRRLGISEEMRSYAVSPDNPFAVIWASHINGYELARFDYPTVTENIKTWKEENDGTKPVEPMMRVSQVIIEPAMRDILLRDAKENVTIRYNCKLDCFEQGESGVICTLKDPETNETCQVRAKYLAGCDGGGSAVRRQLGYELHEMPVGEILRAAGGVIPNIWALIKSKITGNPLPDGRVYIIHFTSKDKHLLEKFGVAWHTQLPSGATLISQNDLDTWTMHVPLREQDVDSIDPKKFLWEQLGCEIDADIEINAHWSPRLSVANKFGHGCVWLAGDAVRQVIPTGGYGMNTGVGDAMALGWTLAAIINGWGGESLLQAYEDERRPIALRNREASKRHTGIRVQITNRHHPSLTEDTPNGARRRAELGKFIQEAGNLENEALGIEIGYRYDDSPIICYDDLPKPDLEWANYLPSTAPGCRPPSVWLADGTNIFDHFELGFTLLRFKDIDVSSFEAAADDKGVPLTTVDIRDAHARKLYEQDLVLLRPDQHVCWRGADVPRNPSSIINKVRGKV